MCALHYKMSALLSYHTHTHARARAHTHTHIHTYIHTHKHSLSLFLSVYSACACACVRACVPEHTRLCQVRARSSAPVAEGKKYLVISFVLSHICEVGTK